MKNQMLDATDATCSKSSNVRHRYYVTRQICKQNIYTKYIKTFLSTYCLVPLNVMDNNDDENSNKNNNNNNNNDDNDNIIIIIKNK